MENTKIHLLLDEASKYIQNPDVIIDVYDMTYVWVSSFHCEVTGYSNEEEVNMRIAGNSQLVNGDTRQMAPETSEPYKPFDRDVIITTKNGERKIAKVHSIVIEYERQPYLVGKMESVVSG